MARIVIRITGQQNVDAAVGFFQSSRREDAQKLQRIFVARSFCQVAVKLPAEPTGSRNDENQQQLGCGFEQPSSRKTLHSWHRHRHAVCGVGVAKRHARRQILVQKIVHKHQLSHNVPGLVGGRQAHSQAYGTNFKERLTRRI